MTPDDLPDHPSSPLIQVAGIRSLDEARMLVACGVTHLGYPLVLDHHQEDLPSHAVREIVAHIGPSATHVLITYLTSPRAIIELAHDLDIHWVQLHAPMPVSSLQELRHQAPHLTVIKSVIFGREDIELTLRDALAYTPHVNWLITDTYDPVSGASGATGLTHDWSFSRRLVQQSKRPVILAGGLHDANVADAIEAVRPAGVDVHTGVEGHDGFKDRSRVKAFVSIAHQKLQTLSS